MIVLDNNMWYRQKFCCRVCFRVAGGGEGMAQYNLSFVQTTFLCNMYESLILHLHCSIFWRREGPWKGGGAGGAFLAPQRIIVYTSFFARSPCYVNSARPWEFKILTITLHKSIFVIYTTTRPQVGIVV